MGTYLLKFEVNIAPGKQKASDGGAKKEATKFMKDFLRTHLGGMTSDLMHKGQQFGTHFFLTNLNAGKVFEAVENLSAIIDTVGPKEIKAAGSRAYMKASSLAATAKGLSNTFIKDILSRDRYGRKK